MICINYTTSGIKFLCSFQLIFAISFCTQWLAWIKTPSNLKRKSPFILCPYFFMLPIRTTTNKLEINEIWKFSLTALLIEKKTTLVQKHSWVTSITWCKLSCPSFGATGKLCQGASDSLGTLFFLLKGRGSRRNYLHKKKIQMTELIFRFYSPCIFSPFVA